MRVTSSAIAGSCMAVMRMAEARLKETVAPSAAAVRFGYFFPTFREHGERIQWEAAELGKILPRAKHAK